MATDSDAAPPVPVDPSISGAAAAAAAAVAAAVDSTSRSLRRSLSHGSASASTVPAADSAAPPLRRCLSHGSASLIGRRRVMEDTVAVAPVLAVPGYEFFAVYDGHGGARVAEACRDRMHRLLAEEVLAYGGLGPEAVAACFARMDAEMADGVAAVDMTVGSTAVVVLLGAERIVVANCGDSRAVLCRGGAPMALSSDHKPNREDEMERVEAAGGRVIEWDGYRVLGVLATSRSIGDHYLRPYVISEPEVMVIDRTEKDEFLILASDGLWDVMSNEVACRATRYCLAGYGAKKFPEAVSGRTASEAAALLAQLAMSRGSKDNISVVVVELNKLQRRKHPRS